MNVFVELFGQFSDHSDRCHTLNLEQPITVGEAAVHLKLDLEQVGLITINGVQSEMDDLLVPDCRLCFFPYIFGG